MFLEKLISEEKSSFLHRVKNSFSRPLSVLLISGTLALAGCQKSEKCYADKDCPSQQEICSPAGRCVESGHCYVDNDCPSPQYCEDDLCREPSIDFSTPEGAYQGLVPALKEGNLEESLKYISLSSQNLQKALAGSINLPSEMQGFGYGQSLSQIGNQLGDNNLTFKKEFGNYRDYSFTCQDASGQSWECLIRFFKEEDGKWKIYGF